MPDIECNGPWSGKILSFERRLKLTRPVFSAQFRKIESSVSARLSSSKAVPSQISSCALQAHHFGSEK